MSKTRAVLTFWNWHESNLNSLFKTLPSFYIVTRLRWRLMKFWNCRLMSSYIFIIKVFECTIWDSNICLKNKHRFWQLGTFSYKYSNSADSKCQTRMKNLVIYRSFFQFRPGFTSEVSAKDLFRRPNADENLWLSAPDYY